MYIIQSFKIKINMKSLTTILSIFFILLATTNGFSQTDSKDVSITSSGSGKTLEDAKQAFGDFKNAISGSITGALNFASAIEDSDFLSGLQKQADTAIKFSDRVGINSLFGQNG